MNVEALKAAGRAAIVMPANFAFASLVIGRPQLSLFAAFGSFAVLVLVEFGGLRRVRALAYLAFGIAGAGLISLGTLCSHDAWLATGAMAVVGFGILFAGGFSGYVAAAGTGAVLLLVLPENVPAPDSAIPDRLLGWALAAGVGTLASLFLWPPRRRADLRHAAADAIGTVVALLEEPQSGDEQREAARAAAGALTRSVLGSQHRPTGTEGATAALAAIPEELLWLLSFVAQPLGPSSAEEREALASAAAVLRAGVDRLDGGDARADFDRLDQAQHALLASVKTHLPAATAAEPGAVVPPQLETAFRVRAVTAASRQLATYAMRATAGNLPPDEHAGDPTPLEAVEQVAREHVSPRSVWLQNSVRGAIALAVAVFVAQRAGLQHSFWIVLGTLSVLRSNALGTGRSIVTALAGTAAGLVLGAALVIGIGTHHSVLWAVLPFAVLLASYAPRAISFAAGQTGFTVVLFVLFNLIQPVGWRVGIVRIEDVAIGFAVSLGVGLLFWPRGAAAALSSNLAQAYALGADYVAATMRRLLGAGTDADARRAAAAVDAAVHRLDDTFRQYLSERVATGAKLEDVAALVGGAARVRRTAQSLAALPGTPESHALVAGCGSRLDGELNAAHAWYVSLGYALVNGREVGPPHLRDGEGRREALACSRRAAAGDGAPALLAELTLLWAIEHLDVLRSQESRVAARANAVIESRRDVQALLRLRPAS